MGALTLRGVLERALMASKSQPSAPNGLMGVDGHGGWWPIIREPFSGAWQRNEEVRLESGVSNPTVFRCISLISADFAKMPLCLKYLTPDGVWEDAESPSFSPVLKKPNHFQNRIQFLENWQHSKQSRGNAYVLKQRDNRGVVVKMYVLDPGRVTPMVTIDGDVYYQLNTDRLTGLPAQVTVPASEIIHDRWNCLFHPLVGLSPLYACGLAALQGVEIPRAQTRFFRNGSRPNGVLTAPGHIEKETADRLRAAWEEKFGGENIGAGVAVLGDGLKYEAMSITAVEAQLIDQLKWTDEKICSAFGVPAYMVGVGQAPAYNNVEALAQQYYSQCLQIHIESAELCLDEGLGLDTKKDGVQLGVEFDLDALLRMDTATLIKTLGDATTKALMKPDEARKKLGLGKVKGGDAVYLQQQNFSLEALAKRDSSADPFATGGAAVAPVAPAEPAAEAANDDAAAQARAWLDGLKKGLA